MTTENLFDDDAPIPNGLEHVDFVDLADITPGTSYHTTFNKHEYEVKVGLGEWWWRRLDTAVDDDGNVLEWLESEPGPWTLLAANVRYMEIVAMRSRADALEKEAVLTHIRSVRKYLAPLQEAIEKAREGLRNDAELNEAGIGQYQLTDEKSRLSGLLEDQLTRSLDKTKSLVDDYMNWAPGENYTIDDLNIAYLEGEE